MAIRCHLSLHVHNNCLWRRVLKNPIIFQMDNKFLTFTENDSIIGFICLSSSEEPASGPYRDPQSGPLSASHSLRCLVLPFATCRIWHTLAILQVQGVDGAETFRVAQSQVTRSDTWLYFAQEVDEMKCTSCMHKASNW